VPSTESSDPSRPRRPVKVKVVGQVRPTSSTVAGDKDGFVDVEDLTVVDEACTSVDDCLITSLRAEVSWQQQMLGYFVE